MDPAVPRGQPPLGQPRDAEEQDVRAAEPLPPAVVDGPAQGDRRRAIDQDQPIDRLGVRQRRLGGHDAAPVVPQDVGRSALRGRG